MVYKLFLDTSRTQPARTIIAVVAFVTLLAGIWILTPWYTPLMAAPALTAAFHLGQYAAATVNCLVCVPSIIAVRRGQPSAIARGSFYLFVWYTFVTFTRILVFPPAALYWIPTGIIAMVLSIIYIEQRFQARRDEQ